MSLLVIGSDRAEEFYNYTRKFAGDREVFLWPDVDAPEKVRYALAWQPKPGELKKFPNLELIVSVGAGVDHVFKDPELPNVPIVRYVDPDLTTRMVQFVVLHTLLHVRRMTEYRALQQRSEWQYLPEPMPQQVRVGIMGLGVLGQAAARALAGLGYRLRGWTRTPRPPGSVDGIECFAGEAGLDPFLNQTDILVVLLPLTPDTRGIVNRALLRKLSASGR
ncbi:MAG: glyoxylate/hydroxypyruvate reductase A, partial [Alphaproteobacteria bacterium]|nr:glyoxylate/hydroxypyruvate reductase A [Alphaproteobacteria bacterium]